MIAAPPQCTLGSLLSPCLCSLGAHCEFGAAAPAVAVCSHPPPPRLTASSKPVMEQTTSSGGRFIPTWKKHTGRDSYSAALPKVFFFFPFLNMCPLRGGLSDCSLSACPNSTTLLLFTPKVRERRNQVEIEELAAEPQCAGQGRRGCTHGHKSLYYKSSRIFGLQIFSILKRKSKKYIFW